MSQAFRLVAFSLFIASSYQDVKGQEISLIQDEAVSATVVLPDFPPRIEKHAGQLFCRYLAMMANQSLVPSPIRESEFTSNSGQSVVLIGKSESNQIIHQMVKKGLFRLSQDSPGGDGIVVKTIYDQQTNYLVIGGSSDRAVLYATTHFLEQTGKVGVFWDGEYIPKRKSWKVTNLSINEKPHFPLRQYNQGCVFTYSWIIGI